MYIMLRVLSRKIFYSNSNWKPCSCSHFYVLRCLDSYSTSAIKNALPTSHVLRDYLITSCGFSEDKAVSLSDRLDNIVSPKQLDSIVDFMRQSGFGENYIEKFIIRVPKWFHYNVEKTIRPKARALQDVGFRGGDLAQLILTNPVALDCKFEKNILPKITFWIDLLGSFEHVMKLVKRNQWIFSYSLERTILPNMVLLQSYGISNQRIRTLVSNQLSLVFQKAGALKALADRAESLGVPCNSGMFVWALYALHRVSEARFRAKLEFMKSLGWSELEFLTAFRTTPPFLTFSEKSMQQKLDFLVKECKLKPAYLAKHPVLLTLSLTKRLIPRHQVVQLLASRGLYNGKKAVYTIMCYSNTKFMKDFVDCFKEKVPEVQEIYVAGRKRGDKLLSVL